MAWANNAMLIMAENHIPPTPGNYQVWYTYASAEMPALNQLINDRKAQKGALTAAFSNHIYERFFSSSEHEALVQQTNQNIQQQLDEVIGKLRAAESDTSNFSNALSGYSDDIVGATDAKGLKTFVSALLEETRGMEQKTRSLESDLKHSSEEINKLRTQLEVARSEAMTDQLTSIGNRKMFDKCLMIAAEEACAKKKPFSLIFCDIDHFKNFNDTWGHKMGDHVLKLVSHQMKTIVAARGTPTRYGGEEFGVILPNTSVADALVLAESLRLAICSKQMKIKATGVTIGRITMSFGVAEFVPGESTCSFVERADKALYAAKAAGRNRVEVAPLP